MIKKFIKKPIEPIVVEAVQFRGDNLTEIKQFVKSVGILYYDANKGWIYIENLEKIERGGIGSWIVKGINKEFYFVQDDIFRETYEEVVEK